MSFTAAFLVAAAAASQPAPQDADERRGGGAQVASARVAVQILRPAVLRDGVLESAGGDAAPRAQRMRRDGRVTYEFE